MLTCALPLGHYLECAFSHYENDEQYLADVMDEEESKGVFIRKDVRDIDCPPIQMWDDYQGQLEWAKANCQPEHKIFRWKMIAFNLIETKRNKPWISAVLPTLRKAYHELLHFDHAQAAGEEAEERLKREQRPKRVKKGPAPTQPLEKQLDMCGSDNEESVAIQRVMPDMCGESEDEEEVVLKE